MKHKSRPMRITKESFHHYTLPGDASIDLNHNSGMSVLSDQLGEKSKEKVSVETRYFDCSVCDRSFTTNGNLMAHMRIHNGQRPFKCLQCEKRFTTKGNMQTHLRTHTGDKPFSCAVCGKKFAAYGNCQVHMRTHTKEKPYQCQYCQRCFSVKGNLMVHYKTHTGEKNFACEFCEKSFLTNNNLRVHMKSHISEIKTVRTSRGTNTKIFRPRKPYTFTNKPEQERVLNAYNSRKELEPSSTSSQKPTVSSKPMEEVISSCGSNHIVYVSPQKESATQRITSNVQKHQEKDITTNTPLDFTSVIEDVWQKMKETSVEQSIKESGQLYSSQQLCSNSLQCQKPNQGKVISGEFMRRGGSLSFSDQRGLLPTPSSSQLTPPVGVFRFQPLVLESDIVEALDVNI